MGCPYVCCRVSYVALMRMIHWLCHVCVMRVVYWLADHWCRLVKYHRRLMVNHRCPVDYYGWLVIYN